MASSPEIFDELLQQAESKHNRHPHHSDKTSDPKFTHYAMSAIFAPNHRPVFATKAKHTLSLIH